jgi:RNA polymerase sigma-70 factor (ECF subfamily)
MSNHQNQRTAVTNMSEQNDEALVSASKNGDPSAFRELVERHEGKVAGVVKSMLGDTTEAVDVGQEVFIRFYEALDSFKGDSAVSTYLIRIAINLSLNEIKRRKRRRLLFMPTEAGNKVHANDENVDLKEAVDREISQLDIDHRSVVILRMIEGYSTEETSEILGIPLGTVLSRLSRAQKKLKIVLAKYFTA